MLYHRLRSLHVTAEALFASELAALSLTVAQWNALHALSGRHRPLLMGELTRRLLMDNTTVTRLVDSLEQLGAVERRVDLEDRRARPVALSETGRLLHAHGLERARKVERVLTAGLSGGQQQALVQILEQIQRSLTNDEGDAEWNTNAR